MRQELATCGVEVKKSKNHYKVFNVEWTDFVIRLDYLVKLSSLDSPFLALLDMEKSAKVIYFPRNRRTVEAKPLPDRLLSKYGNLIFGSNLLSERIVLRKALLDCLFLQEEEKSSNLFKKLIISLRYQGYALTIKKVLTKLKRSFSRP